MEEVLDLSGLDAPKRATDDETEEAEPKQRRDVDVEVNGKRFSVSMWIPESDLAPAAKAKAKPKRRGSAGAAAGGTGSGNVAVPMQGTVVKVLVEVGQQIEVGQTVIVLEAMKMENNVAAEKSGTVKEVRVEAGQSVSGGDIVAVID